MKLCVIFFEENFFVGYQEEKQASDESKNEPAADSDAGTANEIGEDHWGSSLYNDLYLPSSKRICNDWKGTWPRPDLW